jgi:hypothetical protein
MSTQLPTHDSERAISMIEVGRPISELSLLFPIRLNALRFYADFMAHKFEHPSSAGCAICKQPVATHEESYMWQAIVNTRTTALWTFLGMLVALVAHHLVSVFYRVEFTTRHRVCASCARAATGKRRLALVLHYLFFTILIISLFAMVPLTVFLVVMPFVAPETVRMFGRLWLLALFPLSLSIVGFGLCRRLAIPYALRQIGRFPFTVRRVHRIT